VVLVSLKSGIGQLVLVSLKSGIGQLEK